MANHQTFIILESLNSYYSAQYDTLQGTSFAGKYSSNMKLLESVNSVDPTPGSDFEDATTVTITAPGPDVATTVTVPGWDSLVETVTVSSFLDLPKTTGNGDDQSEPTVIVTIMKKPTADDAAMESVSTEDVQSTFSTIPSSQLTSSVQATDDILQIAKFDSSSLSSTEPSTNSSDDSEDSQDVDTKTVTVFADPDTVSSLSEHSTFLTKYKSESPAGSSIPSASPDLEAGNYGNIHTEVHIETVIVPDTTHYVTETVTGSPIMVAVTTTPAETPSSTISSNSDNNNPNDIASTEIVYTTKTVTKDVVTRTKSVTSIQTVIVTVCVAGDCEVTSVPGMAPMTSAPNDPQPASTDVITAAATATVTVNVSASMGASATATATATATAVVTASLNGVTIVVTATANVTASAGAGATATATATAVADATATVNARAPAYVIASAVATASASEAAHASARASAHASATVVASSMASANATASASVSAYNSAGDAAAVAATSSAVHHASVSMASNAPSAPISTAKPIETTTVICDSKSCTTSTTTFIPEISDVIVFFFEDVSSRVIETTFDGNFQLSDRPTASPQSTPVSSAEASQSPATTNSVAASPTATSVFEGLAVTQITNQPTEKTYVLETETLQSTATVVLSTDAANESPLAPKLLRRESRELLSNGPQTPSITKEFSGSLETSSLDIPTFSSGTPQYMDSVTTQINKSSSTPLSSVTVSSSLASSKQTVPVESEVASSSVSESWPVSGSTMSSVDNRHGQTALTNSSTAGSSSSMEVGAVSQANFASKLGVGIGSALLAITAFLI